MGEGENKYVSVCLPRLQTHLDVAAAAEKKRRVSCQGFTLVELIIAFFIVVTLAAIAVPLYGDYIYKASLARSITEIRALEEEIAFFRNERGRFPGWEPGMLETLQEIGRDNFLDPWGTPYQYRNLALSQLDNEGKPKKCRKDRSRNPLNYDFDLYSVGPDRKIPTKSQITVGEGADDIIRAANGRYVGEGSKF